MTLDASVGIDRGEWDLRARLRAESGEVIVVVGPNGSGKTTVLNALAGFAPIGRGHIRYEASSWDDPQADDFVAPDQRDASLCFQDARLFPHLTVRDNVAFPARCAGLDQRRSRAQARGWLDRFDVGALADRWPSELSGGQAQRVALARCLAREASLLLLDEPTASLDGQATTEVRGLLKELLNDRAGVTVLVSHDPQDALSLADRIVVLEDGRITHSGSTKQIAAAPNSQYVAQMVGVNLLSATAAAGVVSFGQHLQLQVPGPGSLTGDVRVAIPMCAVNLADPLCFVDVDRTKIAWLGIVEAVEQQWTGVRVRVGGDCPLTAEVPLADFDARRFAVGAQVSVEVAVPQIHSYRTA